ncbi:MAG: LysR family transcriptional regulator [Kiloniellales bacterium]
MNLASVDLNLLKAFDALYREGSVTRAGTRIGLAQPSMSNALARLRQLFGDSLFIRTPRGMAPTEQAERLAPKIAAALALIQEAVEPPAPFDPKRAAAEIVIATSDDINLTLSPRLAWQFGAAAPNFDLHLRPLDKDRIFAELDAGGVDMAIGRFPDLPPRFLQQALWQDDFVCIARRDHPAPLADLSPRRFAELPQVLMTLRADERGAVDAALQKLGLRRRVALTVGQFIVIPDIVGRTDYIAAIPRSVAEALAERAGCSLHPMPIAMEPWTISLVWSQATQSNPAKSFAVSEIVQIAKRV